MTRRDPEREIGLDVHQTGEYVYVPGTKGARELTYDDQRYEHCAEDADGCWLYRRCAF